MMFSILKVHLLNVDKPHKNSFAVNVFILMFNMLELIKGNDKCIGKARKIFGSNQSKTKEYQLSFERAE